MRNVLDTLVVLDRCAAPASPAPDDVEVSAALTHDSTVSASDVLSIGDPVERAQAATAAITALLAVVTELAGVRRAAILELRRAHSQRAVAILLDLSQSRVNQIERGKP